jgi:uncharacterized SAM-binding protein YcdF (DUF218 family)
MKSAQRVLGIVLCLAAVLIAAGIISCSTIPSSNTGLDHFDTLIVLGTPAESDGTPSPEQRERTLEGVREYKAGVAPRIIMTGGPAHNQYVEAEVMRKLAIEQGVPASAVIAEGQALNTIQNIFYSERIMATNHWTNAEVISSPNHLPRAALILAHYRFAWRTHAAPWPREYSLLRRAAHWAVEAEYDLRLRFVGFPRTQYLPQS